MNIVMYIAKLILIGLYVTATSSLFVPAMAGQSTILVSLVVLLLVIHLIEYVVLKDKLNAAASGKNHFFQTLLFGVAHTKPVLTQNKA